MTAGPDRAAHELRNTLATARRIADFHTPGTRARPIATAPPGRTCARAGCHTQLSIYNHGTRCDTCQRQWEAWIR